ncbi:SRPBCC domain-containing protein [Subtercola sp. YIM 133946]|uniref:SRPBCC domain-containing protein n=1 Tax=Subtercola sp. YIM 133946 TaxID=3118909 RepID=UPI002F91E58F
MTNTTSTSYIDIAAGADRVWAAVTRPDLVQRWQYGSRLITDWNVGGPIRFVSEWEGQRFEQWGTVLSVDSGRSLAYTLFAPRPDLADAPENYFTMTYTLEPAPSGSGTRITIVQDDPRPAAPGEESFGDDFGDDDGGFGDDFGSDGGFGGDSGDGGFGDGTDEGGFGDEDGGADTANPVLIALKELCEA